MLSCIPKNVPRWRLYGIETIDGRGKGWVGVSESIRQFNIDEQRQCTGSTEVVRATVTQPTRYGTAEWTMGPVVPYM